MRDVFITVLLALVPVAWMYKEMKAARSESSHLLGVKSSLNQQLQALRAEVLRCQNTERNQHSQGSPGSPAKVVLARKANPSTGISVWQDLEHGGEAAFAPRVWPVRNAPRNAEELPIRYTVDGKRCAFPFQLGQKTFYECVRLPDLAEPGTTWCPTDVQEGGGRATLTSNQLVNAGGQCQANFNQAALVENILNRVYARIGRSTIGGIGVIAVKPIPKGTEPFQLPDGQSCGVGEYLNLDPKLVSAAEPQVKEIMNDFFAAEPGGNQLVPVQGLNALTLSYYLNHADSTSKLQPNMVPRSCNCPVMCFYSTRRIEAGEELLFDYVGAFGENALEQGTFEKIFKKKRTAAGGGR